jgi:hypothetical protein
VPLFVRLDLDWIFSRHRYRLGWGTDHALRRCRPIVGPFITGYAQEIVSLFYSVNNDWAAFCFREGFCVPCGSTTTRHGPVAGDV